jgi:hypothetical protein
MSNGNDCITIITAGCWERSYTFTGKLDLTGVHLAGVHLAGGHTLGATVPKRDLIWSTIDVLTAVKSPDLSTSGNSTVPWVIVNFTATLATIPAKKPVMLRWTGAREEYYLSMFINAMREGQRLENGWKPQMYVDIAASFRTIGFGVVTRANDL